MKMTKEHQVLLASLISKVDTEALRESYISGSFHNADRVKDINQRYRWDLLNLAVSSSWICKNLYPYLDDSHIESVLKSLIKPLVRP